MKPCAKNRKRIAWLALDALDPEQARELRAHIGGCEGCRRYLEEITETIGGLKEAPIRTGIEPSESFHRNVARAIRAEESRSLWEAIAAPFRAAPLRWRATVPALCALAVGLVALSILASRFRTGNLPSPSSAGTVSAPGLNSDLPPTIANYRRAANQSLDALDDLLALQADRPVGSPPPIYTASTFALVEPAD
jgi:anti-sigma factor RsiW